VTILPLGLLGVFTAVWKIRKFPHFFEVGGETIFGRQDFQHIFNTCGTFHLLTNTSKENREISPFLEGVKKRLSLDTIIFNTCSTFQLLTNTSNHGRV